MGGIGWGKGATIVTIISNLGSLTEEVGSIRAAGWDLKLGARNRGKGDGNQSVKRELLETSHRDKLGMSFWLMQKGTLPLRARCYSGKKTTGPNSLRGGNLSNFAAHPRF